MYLNDFQQLVTGATASASFTTIVYANNFGYTGFQVVWTNHNSGNATFKLQGSIDGVNYNDYTSSTVTILTGSSSQVYEFIKPTISRFIKCVYSAVSATSGTIDLWGTRKGHVG